MGDYWCTRRGRTSAVYLIASAQGACMPLWVQMVVAETVLRLVEPAGFMCCRPEGWGRFCLQGCLAMHISLRRVGLAQCLP
jgi:hypothetical protein